MKLTKRKRVKHYHAHRLTHDQWVRLQYWQQKILHSNRVRIQPALWTY